MPVNQMITISIGDDSTVVVMWPDGKEHKCHFEKESARELYRKVMADLTYALYPVLEGDHDPNYGSKFGRPSDHMKADDTLYMAQQLCDSRKLEINYWQGEWSIRCSGETKEYKGADFATAMKQMKKER